MEMKSSDEKRREMELIKHQCRIRYSEMSRERNPDAERRFNRKPYHLGANADKE